MKTVLQLFLKLRTSLGFMKRDKNMADLVPLPKAVERTRNHGLPFPPWPIDPRNSLQDSRIWNSRECLHWHEIGRVFPWYSAYCLFLLLKERENSAKSNVRDLWSGYNPSRKHASGGQGQLFSLLLGTQS